MNYSISNLLNFAENILNNFEREVSQQTHSEKHFPPSSPEGLNSFSNYRDSIQRNLSLYAIRPVTVCYQSCPRRHTTIAKLRSHAHRGKYVYFSLNNTYRQTTGDEPFSNMSNSNDLSSEPTTVSTEAN